MTLSVLPIVRQPSSGCLEGQGRDPAVGAVLADLVVHDLKEVCDRSWCDRRLITQVLSGKCQ